MRKLTFQELLPGKESSWNILVIRLGPSGKIPRPVKDFLNDGNLVKQCIQSEMKLNETNLRIAVDLTPFQR